MPCDSVFGRLNRTGRPNLDARAIIFAPEEALNPKKIDPLYADCLPRVWEFLQSIDQLDFGIDNFQPHLPSSSPIKQGTLNDRTLLSLEELITPAPRAPVLLPTHLDLLCQTSPAPHAEPDPALYIHGPERSFPEVHIVIRADIDESKTSRHAIESVPPLATEAATVPLHLARNWLSDGNKNERPGEEMRLTRPEHLKAKTTKQQFPESGVTGRKKLLRYRIPMTSDPGIF